MCCAAGAPQQRVSSLLTVGDGSSCSSDDCTFSGLWVPIIHPCWSGSMPVLVEGAAEPVPSADIQLRDPLRIGNRLG